MENMEIADAGAVMYEEVESSFHNIEDLQTAGISATDVKKMQAGGYTTVESVLMATMKELCNVKGVSEAKAIKIVEASSTLCEKGTVFVTGKTRYEQRSGLLKITTGSPALDTLLGGGLESMSITEAFGEFRTGKTQICHTLAVTCQLPLEQGGGAGKAIYIDTEGTFRPQRIVEIAERFGLDPEDVLENILTCRAYTHEQQYALLMKAAAICADDGSVRLLIIDSMTALFRVDFSGRGQLAERQQKMNQALSRLSKMADEFGIAVLITNQVVSDPGGGMTFVADPKKPVGGHVMAHASTTRLSLRKGRGEQRIAKIYDSPCLPEADAIYAIGAGGICDPDE